MGSDPDSLDPAILDRAHLARMTLGDLALEREVLGMFVRQADTLVARMRTEAAAGPLAHALKGAARGIGAGRVAAAAEAIERGGPEGSAAAAIDRLDAAVREAGAAIAVILRAP